MSVKEQQEKKEKSEQIKIKKTIIIDTSKEIVFKAITDPNDLSNWFADQAILEPEVRGKVKFSFYKDSKMGRTKRDIDYFPEGTIIEFVPNKKISYTWEHLNIPDFPKTIVMWELKEIENNQTQLTLTHTGFKMDEMLKQHDEGWTYFFNELEKYCNKPR